MSELIVRGRPAATVFDLLGRRENDMTFALGWGLAASDELMRSFLIRVDADVSADDVVIRLQEFSGAGGFTDIELSAPGQTHVIVEAKRGWDPPSEGQLALYERRLTESDASRKALVILTQWGAKSYLTSEVAARDFDFPRFVIGWGDVARDARAAARTGTRSDRPVLKQLADYLEAVADMRDTDSNRVFVVSLDGRNDDVALDYITIVEKYGRYFFPATGKRWPKYPPNYIAFRYYGRLQSIHHVDSYEIATDISQFFAGSPPTSWAPHYVLELGPPIRPSTEVRTGTGIHRNMWVWADIDLLLTSSTITDAHRLSNARRSTAEVG